MGKTISIGLTRKKLRQFAGFSSTRVVLWLLMLLPFQRTIGQTTTTSGRLMADFYNETSNTIPKTDGAPNVEAIRAILPQELWQVAHPLSIGISDPGLDSATGYRQAWHRALMLLALQQKSRVKMVAENFKATKEERKGVKSRFEEMYGVEAEFDTDHIPPVEALFRLSNGETIVILGDGASNNPSGDDDSTTLSTIEPLADTLASGSTFAADTLLFSTISETITQPDTSVPAQEPGVEKSWLRVECSLYHLEVEANRTQQIFRTEYTLTGLDSLVAPDHETFGYTSVNGRWCNLTTHLNGLELPKGKTRYFYYNGNHPTLPDSTLNNSIGMATIEGLWPALITSVLWQITGIAADSNTTIRQVSDHFDLSHRDLSRVVENHGLSFRLNRLAYASARLFTLLDIEIHHSEKQ